jgi:hypothetical protein
MRVLLLGARALFSAVWVYFSGFAEPNRAIKFLPTLESFVASEVSPSQPAALTYPPRYGFFFFFFFLSFFLSFFLPESTLASLTYPGALALERT